LCLGSAPDGESFYHTVILKHIKSMYFKMVLLSLVYRASYLGFAYKITEISNKIEADNEISDAIEAIYKDYIKFINNNLF